MDATERSQMFGFFSLTVLERLLETSIWESVGSVVAEDGARWSLQYGRDTHVLARIPLGHAGPVQLVGRWESFDAAKAWLDDSVVRTPGRSSFRHDSFTLQAGRLARPDAGCSEDPPVANLLE